MTVGEAELQIALASTAQPKLWMLQIACLNDPGLIARLFGKRFVDRSGEVFGDQDQSPTDEGDPCWSDHLQPLLLKWMPMAAAHTQQIVAGLIFVCVVGVNYP